MSDDDSIITELDEDSGEWEPILDDSDETLESLIDNVLNDQADNDA